MRNVVYQTLHPDTERKIREIREIYTEFHNKIRHYLSKGADHDAFIKSIETSFFFAESAVIVGADAEKPI